MTTRARASSWVVGLAAGMLSLLAHASFVWQVDGQVPTRIDITTAAAQSAAEPGPVDAIVPLPDGGAWLRRGSELIRLTPDLRVAARANVALAGPMHWESQSRRLWVLAGRDLLRYDEHLLLDGAVRFDVELRGLAASGPDAIWVATDTRLMRFQRDGGQVDAIELSSMALGGTVAGVLADTPRARVWVVATSGEMVAIDVAEDLRHAGLRRALSRDALAVTVDAASGVIHQFARGAWRSVLLGEGPAETAEVPAPGVRQSIGVLRFVEGASSEPMPAVAVPIVVLDARTDVRSHWMPQDAVAVSADLAEVRSTLAGIRVAMELSARCGAVGCAGADPLMATMRAEVQLAGHVREGVMIRRDDRWFVEAEFDGVVDAGAHPLAVSLADAFGNRSRIDDYEVTVDASNQAQARRITPKATPVVSIGSPANNAVFVAPASVTINATASVTGATLAKVEFLRNGTLLATDTTAPYSYAWTNVAAGNYALTAKAYDNAGGTTTSTAVNITVKANVAPSVALTAPATNAIFTAPATIGLAASASDTDGAIAKVEFFNGTTRLATDTTAPYAHSWTNVAGGTYTLTAKATDDKGAVTTSPPVTAIVNRAPTTAITAPANNAVLVAPLNLTVTASASDADGTVSKVEFLRNGTLVATDTTSPYAYTWNSVPLGTYTLTSRATDNRGATTTSAPVAFTVNANVAPTVAITSPAPGARFVYPASVPIAATATDSDGTIARVEFHYDYGLLASDSSSPYAYTWNSPYTGTFSLTARAVDNKGTVTASAPVADHDRGQRAAERHVDRRSAGGRARGGAAADVPADRRRVRRGRNGGERAVPALRPTGRSLRRDRHRHPTAVHRPVRGANAGERVLVPRRGDRQRRRGGRCGNQLHDRREPRAASGFAGARRGGRMERLRGPGDDRRRRRSEGLRPGPRSHRAGRAPGQRLADRLAHGAGRGAGRVRPRLAQRARGQPQPGRSRCRHVRHRGGVVEVDQGPRHGYSGVDRDRSAGVRTALRGSRTAAGQRDRPVRRPLPMSTT